MKLFLASDLHLELGTSLALPAGLEYDVAVLAGDIHSPGHKAVHWAQRESTFGGRPVLLVPGNHEYYHREMKSELAEMRRVAEGSNVHVLDHDVVVIDGVRFLGATLWTDFLLAIRAEDGSTDTNVERALEVANQRMNDFKVIDVLAPAKRQHRDREFRKTLRAEDTLAAHSVARDWLRRELAKSFDGPTVVVTHHAPSSRSIAPIYADDDLRPAFASDLPAELFTGATLWVHGHTHWSVDYQHEGCRVVANQRGYRMRDGSFESLSFRADFVVEVARPSLADPDWEPTDEQFADMAATAWDQAASSQGVVLFLDFDGVLHPFGCPVDRLFCHLDLLQIWLRRRQNVRVVISSSWREHHPLDEMRSYFADDLQDRVIDVTPMVAADPWRQRDETLQSRHGRYIEVTRWLSANGLSSIRWAALDDQAGEFPSGCQQLVLCDPAIGLTPAQLDQVDAALSLDVDGDYVSVAHTSELLYRGAPARAARLAAADMVDVETAMTIAGIGLDPLLAMVRSGRCLGFDGDAGLRLPRWQFAEPLWSALPRIAQGLGAGGWALLGYLETPHGALNGITPRQAVERGLVERVVDIAGAD